MTSAVLTLTKGQGHTISSKVTDVEVSAFSECFFGFYLQTSYLVPRYDVYGFNTLRDITICLLHMIFDLPLWPSAFVKVICTLIIRCILCCRMFVPKMKCVGSKEFEILTFLWRKRKWRYHDVITHRPFDFYKIRLLICKGHIKAPY